jgi:drug/metabolite transporter (DMT)-like permease
VARVEAADDPAADDADPLDAATLTASLPALDAVLLVLLACLSAALFGALAVAIRLALRQSSDPELGALATTLIALALCTLAGIPSLDDLEGSELLSFALAGAIAPGIVQILFFRAVRDAGPARTAVLVGTAPLIAALTAVAWLGEPVRLALVAGTLAIVSGGILLARERIRPAHFRAIGAALAITAAALIALRDNVVRWLAVDADVPSLAAASASLAGGTAAIGAYLVLRHRRGLAITGSALAAWLAPGVLFGLSYAAMFEAYYRARVTVVSPLVATESLWGVLLYALLL